MKWNIYRIIIIIEKRIIINWTGLECVEHAVCRV